MNATPSRLPSRARLVSTSDRPARSARSAPSALAAVAALASGSALAHTGHGHEDFSTFEGMLHALREPDHLAALALGIVVTAALAPWVLRGGRALVRALTVALRQALASRRAAALRNDRARDLS